MTRDRKDRSSNWIIEKHGGSLLRLAPIANVTGWKAAAAVLTFPKQMPDGLLDVTFADRVKPDPFLIEIESYPDKETAEQLRDDAAMVLLNRRVLPDILLLVLFPKGNYRVEPEQSWLSAHGMTELWLRIHVINLWTLSARDLLATNDIGLIPWVPLTDPGGSPVSVLRECRERIEQQARPEEKGNLLAATRVMAEMRYNNLDLLSLIGGEMLTMEKIFNMSPTIQRIKAEVARETARKTARRVTKSTALKTARETANRLILHVLTRRFGTMPEELVTELKAIENQQRFETLLDMACECASLKKFRAAMAEKT
jgi:hypothetical protein